MGRKNTLIRKSTKLNSVKSSNEFGSSLNLDSIKSKNDTKQFDFELKSIKSNNKNNDLKPMEQLSTHLDSSLTVIKNEEFILSMYIDYVKISPED